MLCVMDFSLILPYTYCGIYSIEKESSCTAPFLSINNEKQCVRLFCLSSRFITYAPLNTIKPGLVIEILSNLHIA